MCESTVVIENDSGQEELMRDVVKVIVNDDNIICMDLTGDTKELTDVAITHIDSLKHVIVLKKK